MGFNYKVILTFIKVLLVGFSVFAQEDGFSSSKSYSDNVFGIFDYSVEGNVNSLYDFGYQYVDGIKLLIEFDQKQNLPVVRNYDGSFILFEKVVSDIENVLESNPEKIFTLFVDYESDVDLEFLIDVFDNSNVSEYLFNNVQKEWPIVSDMIRANDRLVVFTIKDDLRNPSWMHYVWNYATESYLSGGEELDFKEMSLRLGEKGQKELLLFNEFQNRKLSDATLGDLLVIQPRGSISFDNLNSIITGGIEFILKAWRTTGKKPNFVFEKYHGLEQMFVVVLRSFKSASGTIQLNSKDELVAWYGMSGLTNANFCFPIEPGRSMVLTPDCPGYEIVPRSIAISEFASDTIVSFTSQVLGLNDNLEVYYNFEGNATDVSSNRNNGIAENIEYVTDSIRGEVAVFTQRSNVEMPEPQKLMIKDHDFTISVWLKIDEYNPQWDYCVLGTKNSLYQQGMHLLIRENRPFFSFYYNDLSGETVINPGEWYHIVWRYFSSTGEQAMYVNGKLDAKALNRPSYKGSDNLFVGAGFHELLYMEGEIDDLCVWSRTLSDDEILMLSSTDIDELVDYGLVQKYANQRELLVLVLVLCLLFVLALVYSNKKNKQSPGTGANKLRKNKNEPQNGSELGFKNYVQVFGGFKVYGKYGENITNKFSKKVRQLFLVLLVSSNKDGAGITNEELIDSLWGADVLKDGLNSKRATMSRLRNVLALMDGIVVKFESGKWSLELLNNAHCDYVDFLALVKEKSEINNEFFSRFYKIIIKGEVFKDESFVWLEPLRADISNTIVDIVLNYLSLTSVHEDFKRIIKLADLVMLYDPINENALRYKLRSLVAQNNYKQASAVFEQFCNVYKIRRNEQFPKIIDQLIS